MCLYFYFCEDFHWTNAFAPKPKSEPSGGHLDRWRSDKMSSLCLWNALTGSVKNACAKVRTHLGFLWLYCDSHGAFFFFFHVKHLIFVILKAAVHTQIMIDKLRYAWMRSQSFLHFNVHLIRSRAERNKGMERTEKTEWEGGWDGLVPGYQLWRGKALLSITVKSLRAACKHANTFPQSAFYLERCDHVWMLYSLKSLFFCKSTMVQRVGCR